MFYFTVLLFLLFEKACCNLWSKGVVHYSVNPKDYDPHSQDVIISTLQKIQNEICIKFFGIPVNYTAEKGEKVLHIHNPNKTKGCSPQNYDFSNSLIEMPVGYKCLNERDITKLIVDMLKASIHKSQTIINSEDLIQKFQEKDRLENPGKLTLLTPNERNYINAHYFKECGGLTQRSAPSRRRASEDGSDYTSANRQYYRDRTWPLGIVVYEINDTMRLHPDFSIVSNAMRLIELSTCVLFQEGMDSDDVLNTKHKIVFSEEGEEWPHLGFTDGIQTLKLSSLADSLSPGHTSHALMMMMRLLGVPMMSNRYDRDNYVRVHWKNVKKGSEHYLEKAPEAAWLKQIPYDFASVTHAPATFLCPGCLTSYTVEPVQDHLWHRTLSMGRTQQLSTSDIQTVNTIYTEECQETKISDIQTVNTIYTEECQNRVLPMAQDRVALAGAAPEGQSFASDQENPSAEDPAPNQGQDHNSDTDGGQEIRVLSSGNGTGVSSNADDQSSNDEYREKLSYIHGKEQKSQEKAKLSLHVSPDQQSQDVRDVKGYAAALSFIHPTKTLRPRPTKWKVKSKNREKLFLYESLEVFHHAQDGMSDWQVADIRRRKKP